MKQELIPYYISRGILAALFGALIILDSGQWWLGISTGILILAGFIWYAHGGLFRIDASMPLFPLRRDERSVEIRNGSLINAVACGGVGYAALSLAVQQNWLLASINVSSLALALAVLVYLGSTIWMHLKE